MSKISQREEDMFWLGASFGALAIWAIIMILMVVGA